MILFCILNWKIDENKIFFVIDVFLHNLKDFWAINCTGRYIENSGIIESNWFKCRFNSNVAKYL